MMTLFRWALRAVMFAILAVAAFKLQSTFVGNSNEPSVYADPRIFDVSLIESESVNEPRQALLPYETQVPSLEHGTVQ
jgi:predicted anti-sigma-YlaC factor YlaD